MKVEVNFQHGRGYEPVPLIQRIRTAQGILGTDDEARDQIHREATQTRGNVSEEDFFLAWHAALIMGPK